MTSVISEKIIKPEQCVLSFGMPTTKQDFFTDLKSPNKDFAKRFYLAIFAC